MRKKLRNWWDNRLFRVASYLGFGFCTFVISVLMTFPADRVSEIAGNQIEAALDHRYQVAIADVSFWRVTGVEAEGIQLNERTPPSETEEIGGGWNVRLEQIGVRFSPIRSLLNRAPAARFQLDIGGGVIDGTFVSSGVDQEINVSLNELDLQDSTLIDSLLGVRVLGTLDGEVELVIDGQRGFVKSGRVELTGEQLTLGETVLDVAETVPFLTELELPTTNFGNLDVVIDIRETERGSRANFERFDIRGRDVQGEVWGDIEMSPAGSRPRMQMRLALDQNYVTEHELDRILTIGEVRESQHEGWYGFVVSGTLDQPSFEGSRTAARGPEGGDGSGDSAQPAAAEGQPESPPQRGDSEPSEE